MKFINLLSCDLSEILKIAFDAGDGVYCRNEGSNVSDAVATLIHAPFLVGLDVGTGTPAATAPTEESVKAVIGVSECSEEADCFVMAA